MKEKDLDQEITLSKREGYLDLIGKRQFNQQMDLLQEDIFGLSDRENETRIERIMVGSENKKVWAWRKAKYGEFKDKGLKGSEAVKLIRYIETPALEIDQARGIQMRNITRKAFK